MPIISVIVPVYNVEPYLRRCVDSILNQTFKDFELILVDDESPDNCPSICDGYAKKDSRVVVIHKENGGLSSARNAGLDIAIGEYISFVDSDDSVLSNYLEELYNQISTSGADVSMCGNREFKNGKTVDNSLRQEIICSKDLVSKIIEYNYPYYVVAWGKMFKSEVLRNKRFKEGVIHEDEFFFNSLFSHHLIVSTISDPLYNYYHRNNSIMSVRNKLSYLYEINAFLERKKLIQKGKFTKNKESIDYTINNVIYFVNKYIDVASIKNIKGFLLVLRLIVTLPNNNKTLGYKKHLIKTFFGSFFAKY